MALTFTLKRNDTGPPLVLDLIDAAGAPVDLSGAVGATLHVTTRAGAVKFSKPATIPASPPGRVVYEWEPGDTDEAGTFLAEVEVDFGGGLVETFPNTTHLQVIVRPDLA